MGDLDQFLTQEEVDFFFNVFSDKETVPHPGLLKCLNLLSNVRFLIIQEIKCKEQINKIWYKSLEIYHDCIIRKIFNISINFPYESKKERKACYKKNIDLVILVSYVLDLFNNNDI